MANSTSPFDNIKKIVDDDLSLTGSEKEEYLSLLDRLSQNQLNDPSEAYKFLAYLKDIFDEAERVAIMKHDAEAIKVLAQSRRERDLLLTLMLAGDQSA